MTSLVAFDLEGTLIREEILVELARAVGKARQVAEITRQGLAGKIDWTQGFERRIKLLEGLDFETANMICAAYTLQPGAEEAIRLFQRAGFKIAVITGGPDLTAQAFCKQFGIRLCACNQLLFNDGRLAGAKIFVNSNKHEWLAHFARQANACETMAFGDGQNDARMIKTATHGRILAPNENILEEAKALLARP